MPTDTSSNPSADNAADPDTDIDTDIDTDNERAAESLRRHIVDMRHAADMRVLTVKLRHARLHAVALGCALGIAGYYLGRMTPANAAPGWAELVVVLIFGFVCALSVLYLHPRD